LGTSCLDDNGSRHCDLDDCCATSYFDFEELAGFDEWNPLGMVALRLRSKFSCFMRDERGNTESALVLIPLVFLFLCAMQLILVIFLRNESSVSSQSQASIRAISGELSPTDTIITLNSPNNFEKPKLLISKEDKRIPLLIPGLSTILGNVIESRQSGIAVIEDRK